MPHTFDTCTVCLGPLPLNGQEQVGDRFRFRCPRCGEFELTRRADMFLVSRLPKDKGKIPIFGHYLRRMQRSEKVPTLGSPVVKQIFETSELPTPFEQSDNLLRLVAERVSGPGEFTTISPPLHQFIVGAKTEDGIIFLIDALVRNELVLRRNDQRHRLDITPTLEGWQRYDELERGIPTGRKAFMAMKFGDAELNRVVEACFRPAVSQAGFRLFQLDDEPKAGSIDDRLRVELQTSRFLIADLTHANNGAYWEAGYAEGLQKPVIYTCRSDAFADIHFDTSHLLTVKWSEDDLEDAGDRLKATIRATLPDAKRTDD